MSGASTSSFDSSRIEFHRRNPDVSLRSYMRDKRCQLGSAVISIQRIYLDQRFWLLLRDVYLGRSGDKATSDLLTLLRYLVSQGKAIYPISESVFIELLKQSDESTRLATAQLIDDLSLGITLIPFDERVRQELCNSFYEQAGAKDLISLSSLCGQNWLMCSGKLIRRTHHSHRKRNWQFRRHSQTTFGTLHWSR